MISEMKRWNLFIPVNLLEKTQNLAKKRGVSSADVVRIALEKYLVAVEKQEKALAEAENVAA
jgi:metal-responsive CopG/Arc/MetJ family transcriptional regulator